MTIEELFGTLQQSIIAEWREHLKTSKYSSHMALDEFYKEMPEKVDALIEAYQGINHTKVENYKCIIKAEDHDALSYLNTLHDVVKEGRELMNGESELESLVDDCLSLIDSTIYKLEQLSEHRSLCEMLVDLLEKSK